MEAGNRFGSGQRGRLAAVALVGFAILAMVSGLVFAGLGCGGSDTRTSTSSQLDDQSVGASTGISTVGSVGSTGGSQSGSQGNVLVDYSSDQCTADMTARYGHTDTARQVCTTLQADYGSSHKSQLPTILPTVETRVDATPVPGSKIPGQDDGASTTTTNSTTGGGSGWDSGGIEVVVPPSP